jgi:hypothetical protein
MPLRERLSFTALMVLGMASAMLTYNSLRDGIPLTSAFASHAIPLFVVAFLLEVLVVGDNAHKLHRIIAAPHDPRFKQLIAMALIMVSMMCGLMSLYSTLVNAGAERDFWQNYETAVMHNYPVALIAQLLVVGPLVRWVHPRLVRLAPVVASRAN